MGILMKKIRQIASAALAVAALAVVGSASEPALAGASTVCDKFASPTGDNSAAGTDSAPLRSVETLSQALTAGQTGCLMDGTFTEENEVQLRSSGITLTAAPGASPVLRTRLWIAANQVTVENISIDGRNAKNLPSPTITGDRVIVRDNDVTNHHTTICFSIGSPDYGRAQRTIIEHNRIHDCGRMPAKNFDHGIYVEEADNTLIKDNWIYNNADRGIQLYPDAAGTKITGNVIDSNGEGIIFSGTEDSASRNTVVEHNVITNSRVRDNVESSYGEGDPIGTGNVVRNNCIGGGAYDEGDGGILSPSVGFTAKKNLTVAPDFVDQAAGDYKIPSDDPCAEIVAGATAPSISIKSSRHRVSAHQRIKLVGKAKGVSSIRILAHTSHGWRSVAKQNAGNGRFSVKVKTRRSGTLRLKAVAHGAEASRVVKVHVKRRHRHRHRGHHHRGHGSH